MLKAMENVKENRATIYIDIYYSFIHDCLRQTNKCNTLLLSCFHICVNSFVPIMHGRTDKRERSNDQNCLIHSHIQAFINSS